MKNFEWIISTPIDGSVKWTCTRCDESTFQPNQKIKLNTLINLMNSFLESHRDCEKKIKFEPSRLEQITEYEDKFLNLPRADKPYIDKFY